MIHTVHAHILYTLLGVDLSRKKILKTIEMDLSKIRIGFRTAQSVPIMLTPTLSIAEDYLHHRGEFLVNIDDIDSFNSESVQLQTEYDDYNPFKTIGCDTKFPFLLKCRNKSRSVRQYAKGRGYYNKTYTDTDFQVCFYQLLNKSNNINNETMEMKQIEGTILSNNGTSPVVTDYEKDWFVILETVQDSARDNVYTMYILAKYVQKYEVHSSEDYERQRKIDEEFRRTGYDYRRDKPSLNAINYRVIQIEFEINNFNNGNDNHNNININIIPFSHRKHQVRQQLRSKNSHELLMVDVVNKIICVQRQISYQVNQKNTYGVIMYQWNSNDISNLQQKSGQVVVDYGRGKFNADYNQSSIQAVLTTLTHNDAILFNFKDVEFWQLNN